MGETICKHKVLAIVEEQGAERASYALKLLQSEGELTIASTGKDPATGRLVTQEYRVEGPVMIFLTTTAIEIDEELLNRCLVLTVDEDREQTGPSTACSASARRSRACSPRGAQRPAEALPQRAAALAPLAVVNPFAPALTFATGDAHPARPREVPDADPRDRAASPAPAATEGGAAPYDGETVEYIEVTLEDIALANRLAHEVLGRSLDELPPQTRRLLGHIRELVKRKRQEHGAGGRAQAPDCFSRKELRETLRLELTQVRVHLERLVELEYLAVRHGRWAASSFTRSCSTPMRPRPVAHVGLIQMEVLRAATTTKPTWRA